MTQISAVFLIINSYICFEEQKFLKYFFAVRNYIKTLQSQQTFTKYYRRQQIAFIAHPHGYQ